MAIKNKYQTGGPPLGAIHLLPGVVVPPVLQALGKLGIATAATGTLVGGMHGVNKYIVDPITKKRQQKHWKKFFSDSEYRDKYMKKVEKERIKENKDYDKVRDRAIKKNEWLYEYQEPKGSKYYPTDNKMYYGKKGDAAFKGRDEGWLEEPRPILE